MGSVVHPSARLAVEPWERREPLPSADKAGGAALSWRSHFARTSRLFSSTASRFYPQRGGKFGPQACALQRFSASACLHDDEAKGHADRVAHNACLIGKRLELSGAELETLYWGALLHDLGKVAIADSILFKPGPLTPAEYAEVKRHPGHGAELIETSSAEFGEIATVVRFHHERWDGEGYPVGLRGETIPLLSRIVAVADVFEALTSERPYRRPLAAAEALAYIEDQAGRHFDPQLVVVFRLLFEEGTLRVAPRSALRGWSFERSILRAVAAV